MLLQRENCVGNLHFNMTELQLRQAAQRLNCKLEIAGRTIKVSSVTEHVGVQDAGAKTADLMMMKEVAWHLMLRQGHVYEKIGPRRCCFSVAGTFALKASNKHANGWCHSFPNMLRMQFIDASMVPEPIENPNGSRI